MGTFYDNKEQESQNSLAAEGGPPLPAPILVEVVEEFECTTEGIFEDEDDCTR